MARHKLTWLDRLRGWHWRQSLWFDYHGDYVGTIWSKRSN
jgi:hypothetical protein